MRVTTCFVLICIVLFSISSAEQICLTENIIDADFGGAWDVVADDVDGDGDIDLAAVAYMDGEVAWYENDGEEYFTKHLIDDDFFGGVEVFTVDIDNDNDIDVLGASYENHLLAFWQNDGNQNFTRRTVEPHYPGAKCICSVDMDHDGDMDMISAGYYRDDISWWENDGTQNFTRHIVTQDFDGSHDINVLDFDRDGDYDIVGAAKYANEIAWWENDGQQHFTKWPIATHFRGSWDVFASDIDSDGDMDVLGCGPTGSYIAWWENDGNMGFTRHLIDVEAPGAVDAAAADLDSDGDVDVIGACFDGKSVAWYENDGAQNFTRRSIDWNFGGASTVITVDLDDDGDQDVVGTAGVKNNITWWENDPGIPVGIEVTPQNPPVRIPAGGSFRFDAEMFNNINEWRVTNLWVQMMLPDSTFSNPIRVIRDITFAPLDTMRYYAIRHTVPDSARPGRYLLAVITGNFPGIIMDSSTIEFTVTLPAAGDNDRWGSDGWEREAGENDAVISGHYALCNHPNPFNNETTVIFSLENPGMVSLKIYNLMGQQVAALAEDFYPAGIHRCMWDASARSSGIYFCKLTAESQSVIRRMLLLK